MQDRKLVYEGETAVRTVDERPHKQSNDVGDGKSDLCEIEAERSDGEGRSEGQNSTSVHDSKREPSNRGAVSNKSAIRLDVRRPPLPGE